ncbi:hypothetical protein KQH49_10950 [Mycetohabitans sp. B5]|uniref:Uncharacterized protein n=1 Tax=Mycetohabitans endofungorum TaxID=417203 RepID=A0A2P5K8C6_9BURK|nr:MULTISPECIES: hypothetical protein [Mycetohabitans]MCG1055422.1 hypothetical protein [Mycetohabitans sp. B5]PPB82855.1 hypothetical protein B0O95_11232 [Mycetohabitans endofungorum]
MPTLFLENGNTEAMVPQILSQGYRQLIANICQRYLWVLSPGDAIILPSAGNQEHIHYIEKICQYRDARQEAGRFDRYRRKT